MGLGHQREFTAQTNDMWQCSASSTAIVETMIHLNNKRFWLYVAIDPETNKFPRQDLPNANDRYDKFLIVIIIHLTQEIK